MFAWIASRFKEVPQAAYPEASVSTPTTTAPGDDERGPNSDSDGSTRTTKQKNTATGTSMEGVATGTSAIAPPGPEAGSNGSFKFEGAEAVLHDRSSAETARPTERASQSTTRERVEGFPAVASNAPAVYTERTEPPSQAADSPGQVLPPSSDAVSTSTISI